MANNKIKVKITLQGRTIKRVQREFNQALKSAITDIAGHFKVRAVLNTSIDKTPLRKSIKWRVTMVAPHVLRAFITAGTAGKSSNYAYKVHEFHLPAERGTFGKGKRTLAQPYTVERGPGGAYFKRVSDYWAETYVRYTFEILDASLSSRPPNYAILRYT